MQSRSLPAVGTTGPRASSLNLISRLRPFFACAAAGLVALSGCETTFDPIDDSGGPFSLVGYLDPAADTQWIRVMPLRQTVETSAGPVNATVVLEELETGREFEMFYRFRVIPSPVLQDSEFTAHNFWTIEPILLGHTYRLTATRSDGVASIATIQVPEEFTAVHVRDFRLSDANTIRNGLHVFGVNGLAWVFLARSVPDGCGYNSTEHLQYQQIVERPTTNGGPYIARLGWSPQGRPSYVTDPPDCSPLALGTVELRAVASGSPWPFHSQVTDIEFSHPSVAGNVENGAGFVPGLLTRNYPDQSCTRLNLSLPTCEITYGPVSAAIVGSVLDACGGGGVPGATVSLIEIGKQAIGVGVAEAGSYQVEGLDPGKEYQVQVAATGYQSHQGETLVLVSQEVRSLPPIVMAQLNPGC